MKISRIRPRKILKIDFLQNAWVKFFKKPIDKGELKSNYCRDFNYSRYAGNTIENFTVKYSLKNVSEDWIYWFFSRKIFSEIRSKWRIFMKFAKLKMSHFWVYFQWGRQWKKIFLPPKMINSCAFNSCAFDDVTLMIFTIEIRRALPLLTMNHL